MRLFLLIAAAATLAWAILAYGCKPVEVIDPPDGGILVCGVDPFIYCEAGAPGPDTCTADPNSTGADKKLAGKTYPPSCRAYLLTTACDVDKACVCNPNDGGPGNWLCL